MARGPRVSRRGFLTGAAATTLLSARAGWAIEGDTLVVRGEGDIAVLDPAFEVGYLEEEVGRAIFCSLNRLGDIRQPVSWTLHAATELTLVDPLTIAFTLRGGLKWTDGFGPLTVEDVKYSFERLVDPVVQAPNFSAFEVLDRVEVLSATRGIIHLKRPYVPFFTAALPYWAGHIVCRAAVEKAGGKFTTAPPATCGQYRFDGWEPRQSVTLVADPDWPGPPPAFPKVRYQVIAEDDAAAIAYEAGAVACSRVGVNTLAAYTKHLPAGAKLMTAPGARYTYLAVNIKNPKLADPKVRRALQHAIDPQAIIEGAYSGLAAQGTGVCNTVTPGHRERVLFLPDPIRAKALLKDARVESLRLTLAILNDETSSLTAQILASQLEAVGIGLDIAVHDEAVYWSLGDKDTNPDWQALELVLMIFTGGVDPTETLTYFRPGGIGVWNWSQFDSPEFESLYQACLVEPDQDRRAEIARRAQDLMEESGGFVFLTFDTYAAVHRADIEPLVTPDDFFDVARFERR